MITIQPKPQLRWMVSGCGSSRPVPAARRDSPDSSDGPACRSGCRKLARGQTKKNRTCQLLGRPGRPRACKVVGGPGEASGRLRRGFCLDRKRSIAGRRLYSPRPGSFTRLTRRSAGASVGVSSAHANGQRRSRQFRV